MAQSVRERIPELAILKTLGFSDARVTALVLAESIVLLGVGAGLGMAAAASLLPAVNGSTGGRFPPLFVTPETWLVASGLALLVALAVGLPPALRARRLRIVEALAGR
jgi:putative ABC transport system permease protein